MSSKLTEWQVNCPEKPAEKFPYFPHLPPQEGRMWSDAQRYNLYCSWPLQQKEQLPMWGSRSGHNTSNWWLCKVEPEKHTSLHKHYMISKLQICTHRLAWDLLIITVSLTHILPASPRFQTNDHTITRRSAASVRMPLASHWLQPAGAASGKNMELLF